MLGVGRGAQQVHGFHQAVVVIQRHHHGVFRVTSGYDGGIGVVDHAIENGFQAVSRFSKRDDFHRRLILPIQHVQVIEQV